MNDLNCKLVIAKVKYLEPTETLLPRFIISLPYENKGMMYPLDYGADSPTREAVNRWLKDIGHEEDWEYVQSFSYDRSTSIVLFKIKEIEALIGETN